LICASERRTAAVNQATFNIHSSRRLEQKVMSDDVPANQPAAVKVRADLQEVARLLRSTTHLDRAVQQEIADLLDDLSQTIGPGAAAPNEIIHLAESATHLAHQLHQPADQGPLALAKDRFQRAIARAETASPQAAQFAGQILDALASLGI